MPEIIRIGGLPVHIKYRTALFSNDAHNTPLVRDSGKHITNNYKVNSISEMALNFADKLSPIMKKHPKIGKIIFFYCEKIISASEKFKNNKMKKVL